MGPEDQDCTKGSAAAARRTRSQCSGYLQECSWITSIARRSISWWKISLLDDWPGCCKWDTCACVCGLGNACSEDYVLVCGASGAVHACYLHCGYLAVFPSSSYAHE